MSVSRMREMTALGADWWNDSCDLRELAEAVECGAVGATSNPVIVSAVAAGAPDTWLPVIDRLARDHPHDTEDEIAWRLIHEVGQRAAALLAGVAARTGGVKGYLSLQVSSKFYNHADRMFEQGRQLAALAPNIAIKAPVTEAGLAALTRLTEAGVRVNATVSFSVAQAVACAEAFERAITRAPRDANLYPYVTIMVGRVDDHLKRVRERDRVPIDVAHLDWAGIAVFRRAAQLFRERGYRSTLLAAAYRNEPHWREIVGPRVLQSMPYKWWRQFDTSAQPVRVTVDDPVPPEAFAELQRKMPDFNLAYDEHAMRPADFVRYGASVATLHQFLGGYQQLLELVRGRMIR